MPRSSRLLPRFSAAVAHRQIALLRLLARLELVPARWLHTLVAPALHPTTFWRWLQTVHADRLIWRLPVSSFQALLALMPSRGFPPHPPVLYGLTPDGRDWLAALALEEPATLERAVTRSWANPEVRAGQLAHDLLVIEWCARALIDVRPLALVRHVAVALEHVTATTPDGRPLQRVDALVVLDLDRAMPPAPTPAPRDLPWGWPAPPMGTVLAWALELDRGTEPLLTLLGKAVMYRDLTVTGHYAATLGVTPLPVVVAPSPRRAAQIAREWIDAWPDGRGVVAPLPRLRAAPTVLWAPYKTLACNPARPASLWADANLFPPGESPGGATEVPHAAA